MSISNPYLTGDEDADLFEDEAQSTGSTSTSFVGPDGKRVPAEVAEVLKKYVDSSISVGTSAIPPVISIMSEMQSFFGHVLNNNEESPVLLALCDVVNRMSEGLLDGYLAYHETRQKIIMIHTIKFYSNIMIQMTEASKSDEEFAKIAFYLTNYNDYLDWKMNRLKDDYNRYCQELDLEPEQDLLSHGEFNDKLSRSFYKASYSMTILKEKLFTQNDTNTQD